MMPDNLWARVRENINSSESVLNKILQDGQLEALHKISESLVQTGVILADEVGLGKTFVALALIENVIKAGGRVGVIVPPGLMFQWESEIKKFQKLLAEADHERYFSSNWNPIKLRGYFDFLMNNLFMDNNRKLEPLIIPESRPVALISHRFTAPYVRNNSQIYAYNLPTLYWGAKKELENGSVNETKYWKQYENLPGPTWVENLCKFLRSKNIPWSEEELAYLMNDDYRILRDRIGDKRKEAITSSFRAQGIGHKIQCKLIGQGIGNLDLIIIDEAHKSKGDEDTSTELSRLLSSILSPDRDLSENNRILGMTATPVELSSNQWVSLMKRIGIAESSRNQKVKIIESFTRQLDAGRTHPDNSEVITKLVEESRSFEDTMKEVVYRRRKFDLLSFKEITKNSDKNKTSHANRRLNQISIQFEQLSSNWKSSVLAFEGIGKAAKGLPETTALKLLDSRYPSGLLPKDLISTKSKVNDSNSETNTAEAAQRGRIEYWKHILKEFGETETQDDSYLNNHPRVQRAADHIDKIVYNTKGELTDEKILVFGTFTKPLRVLRNVVNFRHILRQIDNGLPVRAPEIDSPDFQGLYNEYLQIFQKADVELKFKNILAKLLNAKEFKTLILTNRNEYDNLQKSLYKFFKDSEEEGLNNAFFERLPGNASLRELHKAGKIGLFYNFLESYILSEILQSAELYEIYKQEGKRKSEKITEIGITLWASFILAQTDLSDLVEKDESDWSGNEKHKKADLIGDQLSILKILEIIQNDETAANPNRSNFCRYMGGETKMPVRRTLQLQFNNIDAAPKVLIAQSMVGREGLNLHEACRRVLIFHPEWNPAVVEQQIGRVDRMKSRWESLAKKHNKLSLEERGEFPYIEVDFLIFEGTYDQYQFERMKFRRENMAAQLFGALLPEEALESVPEYLKEELALAAPNFSPLKKR